MSTSTCTALNPFNCIRKHLPQIRLCLSAQWFPERTINENGCLVSDFELSKSERNSCGKLKKEYGTGPATIQEPPNFGKILTSPPPQKKTASF